MDKCINGMIAFLLLCAFSASIHFVIMRAKLNANRDRVYQAIGSISRK